MTYFTRAATLYTVRIEAHHIEPRFHIPEQTHDIYALDERTARREAAYRAAQDAGLPGWKPWLRELARHARVIDVRSTKVPL